jgi:dienelactone hydrolase
MTRRNFGFDKSRKGGCGTHRAAGLNGRMRNAYRYAAPVVEMEMQQLTDRSWTFSYNSFDGARVYGRIHYPQPPQSADSAFPVMLGAHGTGRSEIRWWQDNVKDRPMIEQTQRLSQLALSHGYAVITIDARYHGQRKDPRRTLRSIMADLHYFGDRRDYEDMVRNTVLDHRVLLDWIETNPTLDPSRIKVAGYSMGAQVALLLSGVDARIDGVLAIAPPHTGNSTALVAPHNVAAELVNTQIWLLSAEDDEYASRAQNLALFSSFPSKNKRHVVYPGGHILPEGYIGDLGEWF